MYQLGTCSLLAEALHGGKLDPYAATSGGVPPAGPLSRMARSGDRAVRRPRADLQRRARRRAWRPPGPTTDTRPPAPGDDAAPRQRTATRLGAGKYCEGSHRGPPPASQRSARQLDRAGQPAAPAEAARGLGAWRRSRPLPQEGLDALGTYRVYLTVTPEGTPGGLLPCTARCSLSVVGDNGSRKQGVRRQVMLVVKDALGPTRRRGNRVAGWPAGRSNAREQGRRS